jgi:hypothetical protein
MRSRIRASGGLAVSDEALRPRISPGVLFSGIGSSATIIAEKPGDVKKYFQKNYMEKSNSCPLRK